VTDANVAGIDPSTNKLWVHLLPATAVTQDQINDLYSTSGALAQALFAESQQITEDLLNAYQATLENAGPGSKHYAYQRDGVQSLRSVFTVRTDIFLIWVMPTEPTQGGGYAIPGDDWEPILASDAECDAQGLV
jgi:hypothetical protein